MLAAIGKPASFADLARYLIRGPSGTIPSPDRVAWLFTRNLPTDDPTIAAKLMQATADLSPRTKQAAYHVMIAWHPAERPTVEEQRDVASLALMMAGLDTHEAIIVGHGDTEHPHFHMLINRVSPGTGRAWSTSHDYRRFDTIMKQLAEVYGFTPVPAHSFDRDVTDDLPTQPTRRAHHAATRGAATDRPQWSREASRALGAEIADDMADATSWDQLADVLMHHGLSLEAKGKGLIIGTPESYTKFSALGLTATGASLAHKFHETFATYQARRAPATSPSRNVFTVDGIDILRAIGSIDQLRAALDEASHKRRERLALMGFHRQIELAVSDALEGSTSLNRPVVSPFASRSRSKPAPRPIR